MKLERIRTTWLKLREVADWKKFVVIAGIAMAIFTVLMAVDVWGLPINLSADVCYDYDYDYVDINNITNYETQTFCCEYGNITTILNVTENITLFCNDTDINLTLAPGAVIEGQKEQCYYYAECGACSEDNCSICSDSIYLTGGETYERYAGACMIDVECVNDYECEAFINETYTYPIEAVAQGNKSTIEISMFNETRYIDADVDGFTFVFKEEFRCPVSCTYDENINWTYQQCQQYLPLLSNQEWMDAFGRYADNIAMCNQNLADCQSKFASDDSNISSLFADLETCEFLRDNYFNESTTNSIIAEELDEKYKDARNTVILVAILALIFACYGAFVSVKAKEVLFGGLPK